MDCNYTKNAFAAIFEHFGSRSLHKNSMGIYVRQYLDRWFSVHSTDFSHLYLPLFIFWAIWKQRNKCIFEGSTPSVYGILKQAEILSHSFSVPVKKLKHRSIGMSPMIQFPCGFFDGAATKDKGGAGFVLHFNNSHSIHFSMGCGRCTNTKAEMMALWALLTVSKIMGIPLLSIYGDSLVIISWATSKISLNLPQLKHWGDDDRDHLQKSPELIVKHVYREHNQIADILSKNALLLDSGHGTYKEILNETPTGYGNFQLF